MDTKQFFQPIINELVNRFDESLAKSLGQLRKEILTKDANDELLTRHEACKLLDIEQTTLYHWTNAGKITAYGIGNRRYYKRTELMESLKELKK